MTGVLCKSCQTSVDSLKMQYDAIRARVHTVLAKSQPPAPVPLVATAPVPAAAPARVPPRATRTPAAVRKSVVIKTYLSKVISVVAREVTKAAKQLRAFTLESPLTQMLETIKVACPALNKLLKEVSEGDSKDKRNWFQTMVVNLLLFRNSQRANWVQKRLSLFLLQNRCPKAVFEVLHKLGISMSYTASLATLKTFSNGGVKKLESWKASGQRLMGVVDNINFRIVASEEISTSPNKVVNATIGFITPLRIPNPVERTAENLQPQRPPTALPDAFYYQRDTEFARCKKVVVRMIGRVLANHIPELSVLMPLVSPPLTHAFSEHTSKVSDIQGNEILFIDENEDPGGILDYYWVSLFCNTAFFNPSQTSLQNILNQYSPEGIVFLGGDLRTVELFTSQQRQRRNGTDEESWSRMRFMALDFHLLMNLADVSATLFACLPVSTRVRLPVESQLSRKQTPFIQPRALSNDMARPRHRRYFAKCKTGCTGSSPLTRRRT